MLEVGDDLLMEYLAESREQLVTAESDLLDIERGEGEIDDQRMNRVFRGVHTIKGGSGFFELHRIGELAHHAENVLALMRSRELAPTPECIAALLRAIDCLIGMVNHYATSNQTDIRRLVAELASLAEPGREVEDHGQHDGERRSDCISLRMLIVEDDITSRLLLQTYLSQFGECHIAVNGMEAVSAFEQALNNHSPYDFVCMDIRMPEMDGRQAVRQLRAMEGARGILSSRGTKIIMVTSIGDVREVFRCFEELCDGYLVKPVDLAQLRAHLINFELVRSSISTSERAGKKKFSPVK